MLFRSAHVIGVVVFQVSMITGVNRVIFTDDIVIADASLNLIQKTGEGFKIATQKDGLVRK